MLFFDRKSELGILNRIAKQSKRSACFTMLVGRRRIGKISAKFRNCGINIKIA